MELLERYLNQIKKHLPFKDREDTLNELRSLILEEFDSRADGINDKDIIYEIIKEYGSPIDVAAKYRNTDPLISNEVKPYFLLVIKLISAVVPFGILVGTTVGFINDNQNFKLLDLLLEIAYSIPSMINGLVMGYGFVFIIFVLIEKYGKDDLREEIASFEPKSLPSVPKDVFKISILEHIIAVIMWVVFLYLLNYTEGLMNITVDGIKYPLLNENFDNLLPFINISIFFGLGIAIIELSKQRRSKFSVTLDLIQTIYFGVILLFLASNDLITTVVLDEYDLGFIMNMFRIMMYIGGVTSIIGGSISYYKIMKKVSKTKKL